VGNGAIGGGALALATGGHDTKPFPRHGCRQRGWRGIVSSERCCEHLNFLSEDAFTTGILIFCV